MPPARAEVIENVHSHKLIEVRNASHSDGAKVQQNPWGGVLHQVFYFNPSCFGNLTVKIVAAHSGKCLQVAGSSQQRGAKVEQRTCVNLRRSQTFLIRPYQQLGLEHFRQIVASHSGKCVAVKGWSSENNAQIEQTTCSPNSNQLWTIE